MTSINDLTGKRFGKLIVVGFYGFDKQHSALWKCLCDCGNGKVTNGNSLIRGLTQSCGCSRIKNINGMVFGRLTVVKLIGSCRYGGWWECLCECGNTTYVSTDSLTTGNTQSCGCFNREQSSKAHSGKNNYMYGRTHTPEAIQKIKDANIGIPRSLETRKNISLGHMGPKNHNWRGGISKQLYCEKWTPELRNRIRAFFNYECILCGKSQEENKCLLSCHHVEYDKNACCDNKIVHFAALCKSCHGKTSHNRERWKDILYKIIIEIYNDKSYYTKEEWTLINDQKV